MLKMDHEEIDSVKNTIDEDQTQLDDEITKMEAQLAKLRTIWQGQDADQFCNNFEEYLTKMKGIPVALRNVSSFVDKTNKNFQEKDKEFSSELNKEVDNFDEDDDI